MNICDKVKQLGISSADYVVIGSGVLDVLGIRPTNDVDLIVKQPVYEKFLLKPGWLQQSWPQGEPTVQKGNFEIGTDWGDDTNIYSFEEVLDSSVIINGVRFVTLEFLKQWKANKAREKDLRDISLINEFIAKKS